MANNPTSAYEEMRRINDKYSNMPLVDRLKELENLRNRKNRLELVLRTTETEIQILEHMLDIAEQTVLNDKVALSILGHLKSGTPYANLLKRDYGSIIFSRLRLLEVAQLIEVDRKSDTKYPAIKVTERGRNLQYAEQTE